MDVKIEIGSKSVWLLEYLYKHINEMVLKEDLSYYAQAEDKKRSTLRVLISRLNKTLGIELICNSNTMGTV